MLLKFKSGLDKSLEYLTAASMAILVIDVTWQVITRFIMKNPSSWTEELAIYLMIWVGLLGSAVALHRHAHLGIDYFVGKLEPKKRLYTEIFVYAVVTFFAVTVLCIGGVKLVSLTLMKNQISPALGIQVGYVYLAVPIAGFFITIYCIEFLLNTFKTIKSIN